MWTWNEEPFFDYEVPFNSFVQGKWRITAEWDFYDSGKHEIQCTRWYGDIIEL
jgi:hypothetical protein